MSQIGIRMYRQGLGDCFLLSFPGNDGMVYVLVDCGVLLGTRGGKARMREVVDDVVQTTNGELDVLVVTHEHWDHVSGFVQAAKQFKQLSIGEVWLAWTENPQDDLAKELRRIKTKALNALAAARLRLRQSAAPTAKTSFTALNNLNLFYGRSTAAAMQWAREGTGGTARYLEPGGEPHSIPKVSGVRVYVLGPPKSKLLKKSRPSKRMPEVYHLAGEDNMGFLAAVLESGELDSGRPFDASFEKRAEKVKGTLGFFKKNYYYEGQEWRQIDDDWLGSAEQLALKLDSHTNNTSLVLAFELVESGRVLLFPGDAQVGNWLSWEELIWEVEGSSGKVRKISASDLLARTVFYKVGHHGSHNATLREKGLELMQSPELIAMIPVDRKKAQGKKWDMPFGPLLDRLQEKTAARVIRSDRGVPSNWPEEQKGQVGETEIYVECSIEI